MAKKLEYIAEIKKTIRNEIVFSVKPTIKSKYSFILKFSGFGNHLQEVLNLLTLGTKTFDNKNEAEKYIIEQQSIAMDYVNNINNKQGKANYETKSK